MLSPRDNIRIPSLAAKVWALLLLAAATRAAAWDGCVPAGVFADRAGAYIYLEARGEHVVATTNATNAAWNWANGTINARPSRWCRCGAGGSCQSSLGLCRELTMQFFDSTQTLVRTATASVEHGCIGIASWNDGGSAWWVPEFNITDVLVVHMVHLDVGFTNSTRAVCDAYFDTHFPRAVETANELRRRKSASRFQWTTFPWLIQEFLDGAAGCASRLRTPEELLVVRQAIERDDIVWQANALNSFFELYDADLLQFSLSMREDLNREFQKTHGQICGKQSDVPGMSIAAVPILAAAGVKAMHIGYNGACKLPEVLPPVFRWRHAPSGKDITLFVEAGYGNLVCVGSTCLAFNFRGDNALPPSAGRVPPSRLGTLLACHSLPLCIHKLQRSAQPHAGGVGPYRAAAGLPGAATGLPGLVADAATALVVAPAS